MWRAGDIFTAFVLDHGDRCFPRGTGNKIHMHSWEVSMGISKIMGFNTKMVYVYLVTKWGRKTCFGTSESPFLTGKPL
jgi:hypothetical protein